MSFQRALMLLGPGSDGKSTALNVAAAMLGDESIATESLHDLETNRFRTSRLVDWVNACADLDRRSVESSSTFKQIVGGDRISAERKNGQPFSFRPFCRLMFSANHAPPTTAAGHAYFRRWLVLPFGRTIEKEDRALTARLTTPDELSGVLNHALDGLKRLYDNDGFTKAEASEKALERFRRDVDPVEGFLAEECLLESDAEVSRTNLYVAYKTWASESGRGQLSRNAFNARLRGEPRWGLEESVAHGGIRRWTGVRLRPDPR